MPDAKRLVAYVGLFWADKEQEITHTICSVDRDHVVSAACEFLTRAGVEDSHYELFLMQRLRGWDGGEIHFTTLGHGKLVLFATSMQRADALPVFQRRNEQTSVRIAHTSVAARAHATVDNDLGAGDEARFVGG